MALLFYGGIFAAAWLWRSVYRGESLLFAEQGAAIDWIRDPALGLVAAGIVIAVSELATRATERGRALARALGATLGRVRDREVLVLALASGVGEEALFRGALQPEVGLALASVVFAAAHFVPRRELVAWSVFALAAGLLLGALYDATGNLVAPVVAHAVVNAVNLRRLSREYGGPPTPP